MKLITEYVDYEVLDNVLVGTLKAQHIDREIAIKATQSRHNISKGKDYAVCVDSRNVISTTKEARDYFNGETASKNVVAMAVVINSVLGKMLASFFLSINKPKYPSKIFTNKEKAINWLDSIYCERMEIKIGQ